MGVIDTQVLIRIYLPHSYKRKLENIAAEESSRYSIGESKEQVRLV